MFDLSAMTTTDVIALMALIASAVAALYTAYGVRMGRALADRVEARETRAQVAANYLALETASSEIFRYSAENAAKLEPVRGEKDVSLWSADEHEEARGILLNLYYQSLNLFEVCSRFRFEGIVKPEVFASWMAWMIELLEDSFFRARWRAEIRSNYTRDIRDIFDVGVEIFSSGLDAPSRERAFYAAVADITGCTVIGRWLEDSKELEWQSLPSSRAFPPPGTSRPA